MPFRPSVFTWVLLLSAAIAVGIAGVAWRRRRANGRAFVVLMLGIAVWSVGDAMKFGVTSLPAYHLWTLVSMLGTVSAPTAALVFVLQYAGYDRWVTRRTIWLPSALPATSYVLALTNPHHYLLWRYTGEMTYQPVTYAHLVIGPWFNVYLGYNYAVLVVALGVLGLLALRSRGVYRRQTMLMLLGALVPLSVNLLWLVGASPIENVDVSSVLFAFTGVAFALALYSYDLLDLTPVTSHAMMAELRDGVVALDRNDRIVDANPVAHRILGGDGDIVGEPAASVVPRFEEVCKRGYADDVVFEADDESRHFDIQTTPLSTGDDSGRALLFRDITERRRVERRYVSFIENASDLIHVIEPNGTITYASPPVESILGYDPDETVGEPVFEYIHPDDHAEVAGAIERLAENEVSEVTVEARARTADGSYRVLEARGRNLLDDPDVEGIVVNSRDITRRKRRERALQRQNEQLEEFASVISHDLRNPLAVARGYAGVLDGEYDDDRIEKLVNAHERMDELLDDLLALAREGRTVDEMDPVAIDEAARMAWATVETGDATLNARADGVVLADESRLRQLLENLFRNSVEHAESPPNVVVGDLHGGDGPAASGATDQGTATERSDGGADLGGFYVADDGPGIPESERDEVFEAGVTSNEEGTGFGLAIVERIAEAHGWRVEVTESATGGARFEFSEVDVPD